MAGGQIPGVAGPFQFEFQRNYRQRACEVGTRLRLLVAGCGARFGQQGEGLGCECGQAGEPSLASGDVCRRAEPRKGIK